MTCLARSARGVAFGIALAAVAASGTASAVSVADDHFAGARCDRLASFDWGSGAGTPVPLAKLDAAAVIGACGLAVEEYGAPSRYRLQLARGHLKAGNLSRAALELGIASDMGNAAAMFILAQMHHSGRGVHRDLGLARELYSKALENGYSRAAVGLVILLESEEGGLHDPGAAIELRRAHGLEGQRLPKLP